MPMKIIVINGPNLQLLGTSKPELYGTDTLDSVNRRLKQVAESLTVDISFFQSNH